jgi:hypothetical protein
VATASITRPVTEKHCSKCRRLLPAAMFNRANWLPSGLRSDCKECYAAFKKDWWARQPKGPHARRRKELASLATAGLRRCRICEQVLALNADNFTKNRTWWDSFCRPCARAKTKQWAEENHDRARVSAVANCAARYAAKRNRTPKWLTAEHRREMRGVYAKCRRLTQRTGKPHHVDHIVPLIGKTVSGLHVPWNLQILPGSDNCKKSNTWNSSSELALITNES